MDFRGKKAMHRKEILECNDIEKLKKFALLEDKIIFYIAETITDVHSQRISKNEAIEDISDCIVKHQDEFFEFPKSEDKVILVNQQKMDEIHDIINNYVSGIDTTFEILDKIKEVFEI
jgi:hypothetical protein